MSRQPLLLLREEAATCDGDAIDTSNMPLRIASIFIIFAASLFGALLPILIHRRSSSSSSGPKQLFLVFKFVGTGVIIGTAWMHLLSPASEALGDACLEPRLGEYDWAMAIAAMTLMVMFFVELVVGKFGGSDDEVDGLDPGSGDKKEEGVGSLNGRKDDLEGNNPGLLSDAPDHHNFPQDATYAENHDRDHSECPSHTAFTGQLAAIFILEFGVIFHSIFIGLVLATTSDLVVLLVVLVFHQLFEGLGLGARLAVAFQSQRRRRWLPYLLALAFALSTPVATAAGLAARPNNQETQLLLNGIFDAISAGILMWTGVVELLGREFLFNPGMRRESFGRQMYAYGCVVGGFSVMTILAKWA